MPVTVLLVALGAMLGAPLRYYTDIAIQSYRESLLPWGTLTVNVAGSFGYGALVGAASVSAVPPAVLTAAGVGFCGALTTYSTFGYETVQMARSGSARPALLNVLLNLAGGLAAAWLGLTAARWMWG